MPFLKWHIDMTIQLLVLMMYVHKSIIYATTQLAKSTYSQVVPQQSTQNTASGVLTTSEKNQ